MLSHETLQKALAESGAATPTEAKANA